jgi:transcriptional regulator of acetoin/glycerol metabolism
VEHELSKRIQGILGNKAFELLHECTHHGANFMDLRDNLEKVLLMAAKHAYRGQNKSRVAAAIGLGRTTYHMLLRKHGIDTPTSGWGPTTFHNIKVHEPEAQP